MFYKNRLIILIGVVLAVTGTLVACDSDAGLPSDIPESSSPTHTPAIARGITPTVSDPLINIVYPDDHIEGLLPVVRWALTEPSGMDIYPLGEGHIALYGLYDTGSTKVRISNAQINRLTYTNWGMSDVDHLKIYQVETVNLRLNGLQEEDSEGNVPISPPDSETTPQVDVSNIAVKPENVNVTLIGAPLVNRVVTHINFTNKIIGLFSQIETVEVTFYEPDSGDIPKVEISLLLEPFGNLVSADGATAGHRYWLRNVTFQDDTQTVSDQEGTFDFFFDTGTNLTIVNNAIAERLDLPSKSASFDCFHGQKNGYFIDSVTMVGTQGIYKINNVSICWKGDAIEVGDAVIGTNFFDRVQIVIDGPNATLGLKH